MQSTVPAATPVAVDTTNAIASNSSQTAGTVARPNYPPSAQGQDAAGDNTRARPRASASAERTDQDQVAASRAQRPIAPSVPNSQTQEPVVAANSTGTAASSPENASANRASRPAVQSSDTNTQQPARKKFTMHEVRRAEPAEPDVRRAEPVPPAEGPAAETPERGASSKRQSNSAAQIEESQRSRNVENEATENTSRAEKPANSEPNVVARPPTKSERTKPKQWTEEKVYPPQSMTELIAPLPRSAGRSVRARFVGVTPDGRWMLQLPSNKIIIVAPPRTLH